MKGSQSTLIYAHVRRELVEAGASIEVLLADVNAEIREHGGIVLANKQILHRPIELGWDVEGYLDDYTSTPFEHPECEWGVSPANRSGRALARFLAVLMAARTGTARLRNAGAWLAFIE